MLRHQVAVLQRIAGTPRLESADRALLSAPARLLPDGRRCQLRLIVTPRPANRRRPHRGRNFKPHARSLTDTAVADIITKKIRRQRVLGWLINEFQRAA